MFYEYWKSVDENYQIEIVDKEFLYLYIKKMNSARPACEASENLFIFFVQFIQTQKRKFKRISECEFVLHVPACLKCSTTCLKHAAGFYNM